jgi:hypothetical protein
MRDFLDDILGFIGSDTLTDEEFEGIVLPEPPAYSAETYTALRAALEARESVSDATTRLRYYFLARGLSVGDPSNAGAGATTPKSNILIGAKL